MTILRYAVLCLAVLAMAWPSAYSETPTRLAGSEWRVVEIDGARTPGAGTLRFTLTSIRGKAACNMFFGAFRENDGNIEIAGLNETNMMCSGRMHLERAFLEGLGRAKTYRRDSTTLVLIDGEGKALIKLTG
jgi:heat shock protein HslJ